MESRHSEDDQSGRAQHDGSAQQGGAVARSEVEAIEASWNELGEKDALWAIMYDPDRRGNQWDPDDFFATGQERIAAVMSELAQGGFTIGRGRALDFGCGVGRLTLPLAAYFDRVDGVDVAQSMIDAARTYNTVGERCHFHHNPASDLAIFDDETFDFVYTEIVLQHVPPALALGYVTEFVRVLKRGAIAVFDVPPAFAHTVRGQIVRFAPPWLTDQYRRRAHGDGTMQLFVTRPQVVRDVVERAGGVVLDEHWVPEVPGAVITRRQYTVGRLPSPERSSDERTR